jgi:hypothetical protein
LLVIVQTIGIVQFIDLEAKLAFLQNNDVVSNYHRKTKEKKKNLKICFLESYLRIFEHWMLEISKIIS